MSPKKKSSSSRKKISGPDKLRARALRRSRPLDIPDIPLSALENYSEAFEWMQANPEQAETLMETTEEEWTGLLAGVAYASHFGLTSDQVLTAAWRLRTWNILNGYKFVYDWETPVATMTLEEIVRRIRQDAAAGEITLEDRSIKPDE